MKRLPLTNSSSFALVDDEDFERFSRWSWRLSPKGYATRSHNDGSKNATIFLHREILGTPKGMHSHHKNEIKLDCQRHNLEVVTPERHQEIHRASKSENMRREHVVEAIRRGAKRHHEAWIRACLARADAYLARFKT